MKGVTGIQDEARWGQRPQVIQMTGLTRTSSNINTNSDITLRYRAYEEFRLDELIILIQFPQEFITLKNKTVSCTIQSSITLDVEFENWEASINTNKLFGETRELEFKFEDIESPLVGGFTTFFSLYIYNLREDITILDFRSTNTSSLVGLPNYPLKCKKWGKAGISIKYII